MKFYSFLSVLFLLMFFSRNVTSAGNHNYNSDLHDKQAFVSGKVVDERGFPVPYAKVLIKDSETQTDISGKFNILNISTPYNLTIALRANSTAVVYENLSISNPELIFFGDPVSDNYNTSGIKISFPVIPEGSSGVLKFVSQDVSYSKEEIVSEGDSTKYLKVSWPLYQNRLSGQLVLILSNKSAFQTIKFKDVSVVKNNPPQEIKLNSKPGKKISSSDISVYFPEKDFDTKEVYVAATLYNYDKNSGIRFYSDEKSKAQLKIPVPDNLPGTFKIKITGYAQNKNGEGYVNYNYVSPGAIIKIDSEYPPELMTPSDNYLAVDGSTRFSYSSGSGTGIYVLDFKSSDPQMNFYIVTDDRESNFSYLSRKEFRSGSIKFTWSVTKYLTYFSTDDFVKPLTFKNDFAYKAVLFSAERSFKTGYY